MADFNKSLEVLLSWEGGYAFNIKDPGGETYCGISRKNWPQWPGWIIVEQHKPLRWNQIIPELSTGVAQFYSSNFWVKQSFDQLNDQDIADKIFQHYVNMGSRAIKLVQQTNHRLGGSLTVDGGLGLYTVSWLNEIPSDRFLPEYILVLKQYYDELIAEHPQLHVFENEWKLRATTIGKRS